MPKGPDTDKYFMEVTEWSNAEGFSVTVEGKLGQQNFELTWGEYQALTEMFNKITEEGW